MYVHVPHAGTPCWERVIGIHGAERVPRSIKRERPGDLQTDLARVEMSRNTAWGG